VRKQRKRKKISSAINGSKKGEGSMFSFQLPKKIYEQARELLFVSEELK
jgi:hypothetical protein